MNLFARLEARAAQGKPLRVGLIGAGKFGSMYLSQVPRTPGIHLVGIADLQPARARAALENVGWSTERLDTGSLEQAARNGRTAIIEDSMALIASPFIDIIIDATGHPGAGIAHVLACCEHKKHIIMVNVEADALAGPLLKRKADAAGIVYSLAYGDQPALICEMVDWARAAGFEVIAAGKGTKYLPAYHASTPDTVWQHYGLTAEDAKAGGMNAQMFNSFLDGTKSAIEMAAVANATGLAAPRGLAFPSVGVDDLARVLKPREDGGILAHRGQVEVISSLERDSRPVFRDLRWGVYVTFAAGSNYVERCFREYGLVTDPSGKYSSMYKPFHLIGLELGISVASIGLRGESTGAPVCWHGDVVATAKRDLAPGEMLDGEGGFTVYGKLLPADESLRAGGLPLGLAHGLKVTRAVKAGATVGWADVAFSEDALPVRFRREMEATFAEELGLNLKAAKVA
ncbi:MAG: oxidoreductase, NAD-binding Rossmann fold family protein [Herminiimonas sp.]|nr:oxidoreductase, NAD-binding Rossmann fold family protein [Herminiimonas sp.]